ncbi:MAG: SDR family NAD(P)-dependent oxidoreductase [Actinomycetota bacterium]|nr:SDR family NAD(P)-dependent oxidoreductase [Actinomycetota bacterium]MED5232875.1 SDR family NAD(P)-dependent oxidoreductase [Actinomycetota bacterium]
MGDEEDTGRLLFAGRSVAVVGAASGIGRSCAIHLASIGAGVVCLDLDLVGAQDTSDLITRGGANSWAAEIDVTQESLVAGVLADTIERVGELDGLLYTAGITGETNLSTHEINVQDFDRVYSVNLRGALLVTQAVLPHMLQRGYGRILHIASMAGKEGNAGMAAYSSTKAGLVGLVKTMGKEYATTGVTINAMAPAVIQTPMVDAMPSEQIEYMTEKIPMQRTGTLQEVSDLAAFVLSPSCSFTTGFTFDLSGGRAVY